MQRRSSPSIANRLVIHNMSSIAWDLGVSDSTAIWFIQNVGRNYHLVDYYESSGAPLGHYVDVLHEKRIKRGFRYAQHWLPHDVKARELNTAMSRVETLRSLGLSLRLCRPTTSLIASIPPVACLIAPGLTPSAANVVWIA
jgi:hypothetical protein